MITNKSTQIKIETGDLSGKGKIKLVSHKFIKTGVSLMHQGQIYARNAWQISCYGMYIARILRQSMARIYKR